MKCTFVAGLSILYTAISLFMQICLSCDLNRGTRCSDFSLLELLIPNRSFYPPTRSTVKQQRETPKSSKLSLTGMGHNEMYHCGRYEYFVHCD
jgi:hypothetical protein